MRALGTFDADRHDHGVGLVGDHRGAVIDLHQRAGDGDASFREDDDRLAGGDELDQVARGQRLARVHGVVLDHAQERLGPPGLGDAGIDREARVDRQHGVQQRAVDQADMIGRDQHARAGRRQVLEPADFGAEQGAEQQPAEIAHAFLAPFRQHEPHRAEACDAEAEEDPADMQSARLQQRDEQRAGHHEGGLQHVAGGDDAGALVRGRPGLHGGEGRNDEQSAAECEGDEVDQHAQARERGREIDRGDVVALDGHADGPGEVDAGKSHHDGADRHQREVRANVAQAGGEQRADGNADCEDRQTQRHHAFGATDDVLDQGRQQRQHDRADQPEPGDDHRAVPQPVVGMQRLQQAERRGPGIGIDGQIGRGGRRLRNAGGEGPRQQGQHDHGRCDPAHMGGAGHELAAGDGAEQDGHEGRAFDQRVAGRELTELRAGPAASSILRGRTGRR